MAKGFKRGTEKTPLGTSPDRCSILKGYGVLIETLSKVLKTSGLSKGVSLY